jgi:ribonuclease E
MSDIDSPAGSTGGPVPVPAADELPEKMRVHALARLLQRSSREVIGALAEVGVEVRSAQSSIDRKAAELVITALHGAPGGPDAAADPADAPGVALAPLFAPPAPLFQPPSASDRNAPAEADAEPEPTAESGVADDDDSEDGDGSGRRRRRRGRRGRGRGRGGDDETGSDEDDGDAPAGEPAMADAEPGAQEGADEVGDDEAGDDGAGEDGGGSRRRRRRRRRRGNGEDGDPADESDPPNTVVRVRAPRESREAENGDGVQGVRGSTRLEAKRQRRRDGRDAGRRRVPILSEAEFLARRESVDRTMVVRERGDRVEIGVLEDDILVEHFVAGSGRDGGSLVGNIYLGRVQNVLPSMEAAFVDIGRGRNAVLYAGEVNWDAAGLGGKARRIEQALSSGDSVLVQVTKDPIGHKGARLTTQISLAGRFLVYVPSGGAAGISRKLPDTERKRLKDLLREIVPSEAGVIIRTASEGVSQEALERDVRRLQAQWDVVKTKSEQTGPNKPKAPVLLYEEPDLLIKVVRDQFNEDFSRLVVEGDDAWDTLQNYVGHVAPELATRLHRHVGTQDVFAAYRIDEQLLKALDRKVWLPSGGTLVIDRTEAMTVIDVNTGKFTGSGGNLEETVTRNNLEAAEEVVRQLRLRDIGGIIVVDFIDMVLEANRDLVLRRLTECLARDRTRHQVAEVTSLGLVQMTRKRVGGGLLEHFSVPCEHCRGRGVIINAEPATDPGPAGSDRSEQETSGARRSRGGRGRRDGTSAGDGESPGRRERRGSATRNGSPVDVARAGREPAVDRAEADTDVGAPVPVPEPAAPAAVETDPVAVGDGVVTDGPADVAAEAVEEVVVERALAERSGRAGAGGRDAEPALEAGGNGRSGAPGRRRGRVTRTAGSPEGDTPVAAVLTVPAVTTGGAGTTGDVGTTDSAAADPPPVIPAQPTPAAATRPRRSRRAASRPAGPPAAEAPEISSDAGGDPV